MENQSFALEHLEGRALFSVLAPTYAAPMEAAATVQVRAASHTPLSGAFNAHGKYTHAVGPIGNPDAGGGYDFKGSGRKASLGRFKLSGHVTTPGFINNGRANGQLIITTARGTLTLNLKGPPQQPGSLPPSFNFRVVAGTGAYRNSTGRGRLAVSASSATQKFVFRFNPTAS